MRHKLRRAAGWGHIFTTEEEGEWEGGRTVLAPPRIRRLFSQ